ncbi:hypothetical protein CDAR_442571 [Caerostris darwini]|uniref:Uncharacterized protein n=1 Tax=Caerostris darwini TaxID=1538125 RepID=A0AAV4V061_9ARAC|nr:hypothetical protein CDAR_442571 [Caerostris darwini]
MFLQNLIARRKTSIFNSLLFSLVYVLPAILTFPSQKKSIKMNIEFGDEELKLIERGFYIEEPNCCITLNTIPKDGNEYVLLQRLQIARDFEIAESQASAKRKISEYNILRKKFHANKEKIKIEFPKKN